MKKSTLYRNHFVFLCFALFTIIAFGQNNCKAEIGAVNDRNSRSVPADGTYYKMEITNTSSVSDVYTLSSKDVNSTCVNTDGSSTVNNVVLNYAFLDANQNPINQIALGSGETVNFFIFVTVPVGTVTDNWSCAQIIGTSKTCESYQASTILHTWVINPNKD